MIIDIILFLILALCAFVIYKQDVTIQKQIDYIDTVEIKLLNNLHLIKEAMIQMKELDDKGGFQSDDEVGQIFNNIKDVIQMLESDINE